MSFILEHGPWTRTESHIHLVRSNRLDMTDRILSTIWWNPSPVRSVDDCNYHIKYKDEIYRTLVEWGWCMNTHRTRPVSVWCAVSETRLIQPRNTVFPLSLVPSIFWLAQCFGSSVSGNILRGVCLAWTYRTWPSHWCTKHKFIADFIIILTLWETVLLHGSVVLTRTTHSMGMYT